MILPVVRRETGDAPLASTLHPVIDRIYRGRNVQDVSELENGLKGLTHFNELKGMAGAASILADTIEQDKTLIIVGEVVKLREKLAWYEKYDLASPSV